MPGMAHRAVGHPEAGDSRELDATTDAAPGSGRRRRRARTRGRLPHGQRVVVDSAVLRADRRPQDRVAPTAPGDLALVATPQGRHPGRRGTPAAFLHFGGKKTDRPDERHEVPVTRSTVMFVIESPADELWRLEARCRDGAASLTALFFSEQLDDIARAKRFCAPCCGPCASWSRSGVAACASSRTA